jgi:hypothetical protein
MPAGPLRLVLFDDDALIVSLSSLLPAPPVTRTVLDIRVVTGIVGVLTDHEEMAATVASEEPMAAVVAADDDLAAALGDDDDRLVGVLVEHETLTGVLED